MSLLQLPDELIHHLLYYVAPDDTLANLQLTSRRLKRVTEEPLLWRYYCVTSFKFWKSDHGLKRKLRLPPSEVDWKRLYVLRTGRNSHISHLLDQVVGTRVGRLRHIEEICKLEYDSKDFLLDQWHNIPDDAEDVIARRYWVTAITDSMHKGLAIKEWRDLRASFNPLDPWSTPERQLERALGAFDMFVIYDQPGDFDDITAILDDLLSKFRATQPTLADMTTRQKAIAVNRWLRINNLTGLGDPEKDYRNLRNCLIGQALRHDDHESIPLISAAIFCGIAERLGMDARCSAFPSHVHAVVTAAPGMTLDDVPVTGPEFPREKMYLDPYGNDDEVSEESLQAILTRFGWNDTDNNFLAPVPAIAMVARTARNLEASAVALTQSRIYENPQPEAGRLIRGDAICNAYTCHYAASWAYLMMMPPNTFEWRDRVHILISQFPLALQEDSWLINTYLWPLTQDPSPIPLPPETGMLHHDPWGSWVEVRRDDDNPPPPHTRQGPNALYIRFRVGQVVKHRRYGWIGLIVGWIDPTRWSLGRAEDPGRAFFKCLTCQQFRAHVIGEDSLDVVTDPDAVDVGDFIGAGQFFRRFDRETCTFVSNVTEEYPED